MYNYNYKVDYPTVDNFLRAMVERHSFDITNDQNYIDFVSIKVWDMVQRYFSDSALRSFNKELKEMKLSHRKILTVHKTYGSRELCDFRDFLYNTTKAFTR